MHRHPNPDLNKNRGEPQAELESQLIMRLPEVLDYFIYLFFSSVKKYIIKSFAMNNYHL